MHLIRRACAAAARRTNCIVISGGPAENAARRGGSGLAATPVSRLLGDFGGEPGAERRCAAVGLLSCAPAAIVRAPRRLRRSRCDYTWRCLLDTLMGFVCLSEWMLFLLWLFHHAVIASGLFVHVFDAFCRWCDSEHEV